MAFYSPDVIKKIMVQGLKQLNEDAGVKKLLEHIDEYVALPALYKDVRFIGAIELGRMDFIK